MSRHSAYIAAVLVTRMLVASTSKHHSCIGQGLQKTLTEVWPDHLPSVYVGLPQPKLPLNSLVQDGPAQPRRRAAA